MDLNDAFNGNPLMMTEAERENERTLKKTKQNEELALRFAEQFPNGPIFSTLICQRDGIRTDDNSIHYLDESAMKIYSYCFGWGQPKSGGYWYVRTDEIKNMLEFFDITTTNKTIEQLEFEKVYPTVAFDKLVACVLTRDCHRHYLDAETNTLYSWQVFDKTWKHKSLSAKEAQVWMTELIPAKSTQQTEFEKKYPNVAFNNLLKGENNTIYREHQYYLDSKEKVEYTWGKVGWNTWSSRQLTSDEEMKQWKIDHIPSYASQHYDDTHDKQLTELAQTCTKPDDQFMNNLYETNTTKPESSNLLSKVDVQNSYVIYPDVDIKTQALDLFKQLSRQERDQFFAEASAFQVSNQ